MAKKGKKHIISSKFEHHAVLHTLNALEKEGFEITLLDVYENGVVKVEDVKKAIKDDTALVTIMYANNEIGTIQPIREIGAVCREKGVLFHTDAVQAVGHIRIDVKELGVDMLSASAHKFNGPKGVGFLYIKKGTNITPYINGGAQEFGFRAGTENVASIVGMAAALKNNCNFIDDNNTYVGGLETALLNGLKIDFKRNGSKHHVNGIINLSFNNQDGEAILHRLDLMGIMVSTGSACDSVRTQISHVLESIGLKESLAKGTIRISLGKNNTLEDVNYIVNALNKLLG
jgi:cysteine desulfurase